MDMKDQLTEKEFDDFLQNIEIESAPTDFTRKVMDKIEPEVKVLPASFTKFKIIYASVISLLLLLSFTSNKTSSSAFTEYYSIFLSYMDRLKPVSVPTFDMPILVALTTLAIFFIILFDSSLQHRLRIKH